MSKTARKLLSQNFLWNRELVKKLIRNSSIASGDSVLDIGAGSGVITDQIMPYCGSVVAFEADPRLYQLLKQKYRSNDQISVQFGDIRLFPLPANPYKVFSNIPFSITGEVVKKLFLSPNPPLESYIVMQREAAQKFIVFGRQNSMMSILLYPWFELEIIHQFNRNDFKPKPNVDSVLVKITRRHDPFVKMANQEIYRDFVTYYFTRDKRAKYYPPREWLMRLNNFLTSGNMMTKNMIEGSFRKWQDEERQLAKIHRTRLDKRWMKYK